MINKSFLFLFIAFIIVSCDPDPINNINGCTDSLAFNYDSLATIDDGSCIYTIYGCTDSTYLNYNPLATIDDGSCRNSTEFFINFSHHVDGQILSNNLAHVNEAGQNYSILNLQYIISDITLHSNDTILILKDIHYVNINDNSTCFIQSGEVESLNWNAISFRFGLDTIKNISNIYVNESFHPTMAWPEMMGGGYHYMKLEGAYLNDSTFYNTHTGPTMGMDFSFSFYENISINNSLDYQEFSIDMNLNNWYQNPNTIYLAPDIMMNMTTQMQIMQNGITDVFSLQGILDK